MITYRTDSDPKDPEESTTNKIYRKSEELIEKTKDIFEKLKY